MRQVFVSRPTTLNTEQRGLLDSISDLFNAYNLVPRTVGISNFTNKSPLVAVRAVMKECSGALVLGLRQLRIVRGVEKEGTSLECNRDDFYLPTAWNHIEASMAYSMGMPILLVKERGVGGGVFDLGATEYFIHSVISPGSNWVLSDEFRLSFQEWHEDMVAWDRRPK